MNEPVNKHSDQSSSGFSRPKPHERLAADKIGEELTPDAGIWQMYVEEAKEHDDELVAGKNKTLDTMLIFVSRPLGVVGTLYDHSHH